MPIWLSLILVVLFLLMNAFFVIAEFSLVRVRKSQIEILVEEGKKGAKRAFEMADNVNEYLSACQLGITLASLALGWLGEPAFAALLHPIFVLFGLPEAVISVVAVAIGYFIMTTLHVVAGELIPKSMAILKTETYALHTAGPLHAFYRITYPIMWLFNATTNGVMRLTGHDAKNETEAYSEEEIKLLLEESAESGSIEQDQYQYLDNIFDLDDKDAKAIMTPRTEVLAIDYDDDLETNLDFMGKNKFTRYPVFREDKDNIVGFVHIKDAYLLPEGSTMKDLKIRSIQAVPESISIAKLLQVLQAKHTKIAVVVDEHGGTSGIVTMTDVVEQIIGRMEDEYLHDDQDEHPHPAGVRAGQAGASGRGRPPQGRCAGAAGLNYRFECGTAEHLRASRCLFFTEMVGINSKKSSTLLQMEPQNQSKRKTKDPAQLSSIWQSVCRKTWRE